MRRFLWDNKRYAPLWVYCVLLLGLWTNRVTLIYSHLPVLFGQQGVILYDLVFWTVALLAFVCIFQELRCPAFTKAKVDRAFKQAGLKNGIGQYPVLVAVTKDLSKEHGRRYKIKNMGVSIENMDSKIDSLQRELGAIYELSYAPKTTYTYLYVLPKPLPPSITPAVYDDDF